MEPNWKDPQEISWQNTSPMAGREGYTGPRRPVPDSDSRAQRPLGMRDNGEKPRYRSPGPDYPGQRSAPMEAYPYPQKPLPQQGTGGYNGMGAENGYAFPAGQAWQGGQTPPASMPYGASSRWTGPTPADPFEEPEEAPELRQARSDNLYNRNDHFWDHVEDVKTQDTQAKASAKEKRADSHTVIWVVLILALLVAVGGLIYGAVFQVRSISVKGAKTIPEDEVIRLSGVTQGMNTFAIDDDQVEKGIESNRYLSFVCVDKQLPDKVVIQVKERIQAAQVKSRGILYTIDNRGMVLEESMNTDELDPNLVSVEGMDIKSCRVGESITLHSTSQLKVYTELMVELKVMSALSMIEELDLTNMENLFLVSRDGYSIRLGDATHLHEKLRAMIMTMDRLKRDGHKGGTIDVCSPVNPTYIPDSY